MLIIGRTIEENLTSSHTIQFLARIGRALTSLWIIWMGARTIQPARNVMAGKSVNIILLTTKKTPVSLDLAAKDNKTVLITMMFKKKGWSVWTYKIGFSGLSQEIEWSKPTKRLMINNSINHRISFRKESPLSSSFIHQWPTRSPDTRRTTSRNSINLNPIRSQQCANTPRTFSLKTTSVLISKRRNLTTPSRWRRNYRPTWAYRPKTKCSRKLQKSREKRRSPENQWN